MQPRHHYQPSQPRTFEGGDPRIVQAAGHVLIHWETKEAGWTYAILTLEEFQVQKARSLVITGKGADETLRSGLMHLAQVLFDDDPSDHIPSFLTHKDDIAEYRHWSAWHLAYQAAKKDGKSDDLALAAADDKANSGRQEAVPVLYHLTP